MLLSPILPPCILKPSSRSALSRAGFHTGPGPKQSSKLPYLPMFFMRILASGGISSGSLCRDRGGQSLAHFQRLTGQVEAALQPYRTAKGLCTQCRSYTVIEQNTNSFVQLHERRSSNMTTKYLANQKHNFPLPPPNQAQRKQVLIQIMLCIFFSGRSYQHFNVFLNQHRAIVHS